MRKLSGHCIDAKHCTKNYCVPSQSILHTRAKAVSEVPAALAIVGIIKKKFAQVQKKKVEVLEGEEKKYTYIVVGSYVIRDDAQSIHSIYSIPIVLHP